MSDYYERRDFMRTTGRAAIERLARYDVLSAPDDVSADLYAALVSLEDRLTLIEGETPTAKAAHIDG